MNFQAKADNKATASFIMSLFFISICATKPIFIDYSNIGNQGSVLFGYYFDIDNGTYVDIGSYDPIQISSTLNLYTMGWSGINIEANPQRLKNFISLRPDDINLNFAIGDQDQFVLLYEADQELYSTISPKVKNDLEQNKNITITSELKVPSMTLGQLCEKYYIRKPTLLSLDIEGYQGKALEGNQWTKQLCRPQFIMSQYVSLSEKSDFITSQTVLKTQNYTLISPKVGDYQIFIANQVLEKYKLKFKHGKDILSSMEIIKFPQIRKSIEKNFNVSQNYIYDKSKNRHYNPYDSPLYYHFGKKNTPVYVDKILQNSNIALNRTIFIFNFNQTCSYIVLDKFAVTFWQKVKIDSYQFWRYEIKHYEKKEGYQKGYQIFVFDHKINDEIDPQLIPMKSIQQRMGNVEVYIDYHKDVEWYNEIQVKQLSEYRILFIIAIVTLGTLLGISLIIILCLGIKLWSIRHLKSFEMINSKYIQQN